MAISCSSYTTQPTSLAEALAGLREYAAGRPFRSAEGYELILEYDPWHRPVRREDLAWIDFSRPLSRDRAFELSALACHRMLVNVYESDHAFLPPASADRDWSACEQFHSDPTRSAAERVRPFLEHHAFSFLDPDDIDRVRELPDPVRDLVAETSDAGVALAATIEGAQDRARAARLLVIQLTGPGLSRELAIQRVTCGLDLRDGGEANGAFGALSAIADPHRCVETLRAMARSANLVDRAHAYWQFYLSSWLGVANHVHALARSGHRVFESIGAIVWHRLHAATAGGALAVTLREALGDGLDTRYLDELADPDTVRKCCLSLVANLCRDYGARASVGIARGIGAARSLCELAQEDFARQIAWADRPAQHQAMARRIDDLIRTHALEVDLDTYREAREERSTTHVHDTDRLLVIESGTMDFWSNFGPPAPLGPGDMTFVPRHRLHGSVVTSEACVYHQPIIDAALLRLYRESEGEDASEGAIEDGSTWLPR